jgi:hypothetical protein
MWGDYPAGLGECRRVPGQSELGLHRDKHSPATTGLSDYQNIIASPQKTVHSGSQSTDHTTHKVYFNGTTSLIGATSRAVGHVDPLLRIRFGSCELQWWEKDHAAPNYIPVPNISSAHAFQICLLSTYRLWRIAAGI